MNMKTLNGLTIFRFVAAFYVFIFHCNIRFPAEIGDFLNRIVKNGAIGMTFFFVLSGFVMAWSSQGGVKSDYFARRLRRIYPAYIFMGLVSLPFIIDLKPQQIVPSLLMFITGTQAWIPSSFSLWNFIGSWSVSTELFFYATFPILFPLIKKRPGAFLLSSLAVTSLLVPFSIMLGSGSQFPLFYVSPIHRLPEFIIGVCAGVYFTNGIRLSRRNSVLLIALSLLTLTVISTRMNSGFMTMNLFTVPATAILIFSLASLNVRDDGLAALPIYFGKISYSFYLMQIPLIMFIEKYHYLFNDMNTLSCWVGMFIANTIMACISYHFVEEAFMKMKYQSA